MLISSNSPNTQLNVSNYLLLAFNTELSLLLKVLFHIVYNICNISSFHTFTSLCLLTFHAADPLNMFAFCL